MSAVGHSLPCRSALDRPMSAMVRKRPFKASVRMVAKCRLCCKSRKLQGRDFFAKTRNRKLIGPIRITSIALPKSPVSFARGDEVPHIFTRKPRLQPAEFLIIGAKRLLQHNRSLAPDPTQRQGLPMSALAPIGDKTLRGRFVRDVPITGKRSRLNLRDARSHTPYECRSLGGAGIFHSVKR